MSTTPQAPRSCARCDHANIPCTYCYAFCKPLMYDMGVGCDVFKPLVRATFPAASPAGKKNK